MFKRSAIVHRLSDVDAGTQCLTFSAFSSLPSHLCRDGVQFTEVLSDSNVHEDEGRLAIRGSLGPVITHQDQMSMTAAIIAFATLNFSTHPIALRSRASLLGQRL